MISYRVVRAAETDRGPIHRVEDLQGRLLSLEELDLLSRIPHRSGAGRHIDFILTDESQPRHGKPFLRPQCLRFKYKPHMTFLGTGLPIGYVENILVCPPGSVPGTEGRIALATATLSETALAALAWDAVHAGILTGVCLHGNGHPDATGEFNTYEGRFVTLGSLDGSCIRNARVLRVREEVQDSGYRR